MHSIRSAARREAWYDSHDDTDNLRKWNMFGRFKPGSTAAPRDVEDGNGPPLRHTQSETLAPSPQEQQRLSQYDSHKKQLGHKSGTYGGSSSLPGNASSSQERNEPAVMVEEPETIHEDEKTSGESEDTKVIEDATTQSVHSTDEKKGGARRRNIANKLHIGHHKEAEETENDLSRQSTADTTDSKKKKKKFAKIPVMQQVKAVLFSWINLLLVFVPVGIALNYAGVNKVVVFVMNFIAIVPLAAMLSFATEELALYVGETLGGLLNATFGNAVELIVSIIALTQGKYVITQTSLIGSMLSNLLLVMGMCFFFGGLNRKEQFFNITVAQTAASLLALAVGSLIIPTAFRIFSPDDKGVAPLSRGTSVLLLVVYGAYLFFQLKTHIDMYNEPSQKVPKNQKGKKSKGDVFKGLATMGAGTGAAATGGHVNQENLVHEEDEEEEQPSLSIVGGLVTLAGSTVLVALCAEYMVSAIDVLAESVSEEFIGLILLPIVGNAAEHATAVTVAIKDKMDLAIGVAVGSSLQIALLVLPLMVIIGWIGLEPRMTLNFDGFQITVLFIAIILVNYLIQDGKSHWLEGLLLNVTYLIIATAAWFYPISTSDPS